MGLCLISATQVHTASSSPMKPPDLHWRLLLQPLPEITQPPEPPDPPSPPLLTCHENPDITTPTPILSIGTSPTRITISTSVTSLGSTHTSTTSAAHQIYLSNFNQVFTASASTPAVDTVTTPTVDYAKCTLITTRLWYQAKQLLPPPKKTSPPHLSRLPSPISSNCSWLSHSSSGGMGWALCDPSQVLLHQNQSSQGLVSSALLAEALSLKTALIAVKSHGIESLNVFGFPNSCQSIV